MKINKIFFKENMAIIIAIVIIVLVCLALVFVKKNYSNISNTTRNDTKADQIQSQRNAAYSMIVTDNDEDKEFSQRLQQEDKIQQNPIYGKNENQTTDINYLYNYYTYKIDGQELVITKENEKTLAEIIFQHQNPSILVSFTLKHINTCQDHPIIINALIAETIRKPLKPYILSLPKNDILKLDQLAKKCS